MTATSRSNSQTTEPEMLPQTARNVGDEVASNGRIFRTDMEDNGLVLPALIRDERKTDLQDEKISS